MQIETFSELLNKDNGVRRYLAASSSLEGTRAEKRKEDFPNSYGMLTIDTTFDPLRHAHELTFAPPQNLVTLQIQYLPI